MNKSDLQKCMDFALELDKEKFIGRQTYLHDASRKENDAEHAWHMAAMAVLLSDYSNTEIDLLKTIKMILFHDVVEIDAGDTYAYDTAGLATQAEREERAAKRLYGMLPKEKADELYALWREFEDRETPEAKFARTMDNVQPVMLNHATNGKAWEEHSVDVSQVLKRNERTHEGSEIVWDYMKENLIRPSVESGKLKDREGRFGKLLSMGT